MDKQKLVDMLHSAIDEAVRQRDAHEASMKYYKAGTEDWMYNFRQKSKWDGIVLAHEFTLGLTENGTFD